MDDISVTKNFILLEFRCETPLEKTNKNIQVTYSSSSLDNAIHDSLVKTEKSQGFI